MYPARFIAAADPTEAAAVRVVDLQKKFHLSAKDLAEKLNLSTHRSHALRQKLGIDKDFAVHAHVHVWQVEAPEVFGLRVHSHARGVGDGAA